MNKVTKFYRTLDLIRFSVIIILVLTVFLIGNRFVEDGTISTSILVLGYFIIATATSISLSRYFSKLKNNYTNTIVKRFQHTLLIEDVEDVVEFLNTRLKRTKNKNAMFNIASIAYYYHSLISLEEYPHLNIMKGYAKEMSEQHSIAALHLYDFERMKYVYKGEYDSVTSLLKKTIEVIENAIDDNNLEPQLLDYMIKQVSCYKKQIKYIRNKDKDLFISSIKERQQMNIINKMINTYIDVKICEDFGWDDLIFDIKKDFIDSKGDLPWIEMIKTA